MVRGETRRLRAQSLVNQNLFVRVRQMILPANHVGDAHFDVVADDGEIVERMTVGAQQNQIFNLAVISFLMPVNRIFKCCFAFERNF